MPPALAGGFHNGGKEMQNRFPTFGPIPPEPTERLRQHAECSVKRDAAARRAIELLQAGEILKASEVVEEAEMWQLRAAALAPDSGVTC